MKNIRALTAGVLLALGSSFVASPAHAFLIWLNTEAYQVVGTGLQIDWDAVTEHPVTALGEAGLCVILLPFCVLDQSSPGAGQSAADLALNGYSAADIAQIQQDQAAVARALKEQRAAIRIAPNDSKASVQADIRKVNPAVSQVYLDYVTDSAGLK